MLARCPRHGAADVPVSIDAFAVWIFNGSQDASYFREPSLARLEGINFLRFSVGRLVWFTKIGRRPNPDWPSTFSWFRTSYEIDIAVFQAQFLKEWHQMGRPLSNRDYSWYSQSRRNKKS
jgi:hypothetical protein